MRASAAEFDLIGSMCIYSYVLFFSSKLLFSAETYNIALAETTFTFYKMFAV